MSRDHEAAYRAVIALPGQLGPEVCALVESQHELAGEVAALLATRDRYEAALREIAALPMRYPAFIAREALAAAQEGTSANLVGKHICGMRGWDPMRDPPCPGCPGAAAREGAASE
jgi:hypothetical protein